MESPSNQLIKKFSQYPYILLEGKCPTIQEYSGNAIRKAHFPGKSPSLGGIETYYYLVGLPWSQGVTAPRQYCEGTCSSRCTS